MREAGEDVVRTEEGSEGDGCALTAVQEGGLRLVSEEEEAGAPGPS